MVSAYYSWFQHHRISLLLLLVIGEGVPPSFLAKGEHLVGAIPTLLLLIGPGLHGDAGTIGVDVCAHLWMSLQQAVQGTL
jgi:hypothetical protein